MDKQATRLKNLIEDAQKVLITSHISPDPDSLCSVLLAGTAIQANYPDKQVMMSSEELTGELGFLYGYDQIRQQPLIEVVSELKPDLIIIVDAMNLARCTRGDAEEVRSKVKEIGSKLVIIDHHETVDIEENQIYINNQSPATAQDVYQIFINGMEIKPEGYAQTTMLGIISDTNRFLYDNPGHRVTFKVVDELIDAGASIEQIVNQGSRYSVDDMRVISELTINVTEGSGYAYSFIGDNFIQQWQQQGKSADDLKRGGGYFVNEFIRNIGLNLWGFMVYRDIADPRQIYSVSFRSLSGAKDISQLAKKLGGGGHKAAAGAKFMAASAEEAIDKVKAVISSAS